jgi:hypothetical protein
LHPSGSAVGANVQDFGATTKKTVLSTRKAFKRQRLTDAKNYEGKPWKVWPELLDDLVEYALMLIANRNSQNARRKHLNGCLGSKK